MGDPAGLHWVSCVHLAAAHRIYFAKRIVPYLASAPLVEDMNLVRDGDARRKEIADRTHHIRWFHVLSLDILPTNKHDDPAHTASSLPVVLKHSDSLVILGVEHVA